jgi:hypothetical protein
MTTITKEEYQLSEFPFGRNDAYVELGPRLPLPFEEFIFKP